MKKLNTVVLALSVSPYLPAVAWLSPPSANSVSFTVNARYHSPPCDKTWLLFAKNNKKDEEESKKLPQSLKNSKNSGKQSLAKGMELKQIRDELRNLRESLMWAEAMHDEERMQNLIQLIDCHEQRDPELVYAQTLTAIAQAQAKFDCDPVEKGRAIQRLKQRAQHLRSQLPRFQMEGLWVGAYGENDFQLVNITYRGDTLVATKTTGDTNVPRGQVSFTADLSPSRHNNETTVTRYQGQGQVAQHGFVQHKFVNGNLLLQEESIYTSDTDSYKCFSFVWYAERQHKVVFQRPTPQQTLNLLRDTLSREDELENMRTHLTRCLDLDATDALARQHAGKLDDEPFRRIRRLDELEQDDPVPKKEWGLWRRYLSEGIWKNILSRKKENGWDDLEMGL